MDVSYKPWQTYIIKQGKSLMKKGVDGLFLDNTDVYYFCQESSMEYNPKRQNIYKGLYNMLKGFKKYTNKVIVNGGDTFVKKLIADKKISLISGVNQETVFSSIKDYDKDSSFGKQRKSETAYYQKYLKQCKKAKLNVYVLEYTRDKKLEKKAKNYCKKNGFKLYVSKTLSLR